MGSSKAPRKGKWFLCFKPEEGSFRKSKKKILMSLSDDNTTLKSASYNEGRRSGKDKPRRSFSRVLRAVLLEKSFSKKHGSKRSGQDVYRASSNLNSRLEKGFNSLYDKKASLCKESLDNDNSVSSRSSLFSSSTILASSSQSSSCSSSIASNSRSASERKQLCLVDFKELKINKPDSSRKKINGNPNSNSNTNTHSNEGLYFLLVCLVGLIFCGKAFAILCTSTCLFLVPSLSKGVAMEANEVDVLDIDSNEYKKKVIMEGLLQRNHTRRL